MERIGKLSVIAPFKRLSKKNSFREKNIHVMLYMSKLGLEKLNLSHSAFWLSKRTKTKSNRLRSGLARAILTEIDWVGSYFPFGLVAAIMEHRVLSLQTSPACNHVKKKIWREFGMSIRQKMNRKLFMNRDGTVGVGGKKVTCLQIKRPWRRQPCNSIEK